MDARIQDRPFDSTTLLHVSPGLKALLLRGGIEGWPSAGRPLVDKAEGANS